MIPQARHACGYDRDSQVLCSALPLAVSPAARGLALAALALARSTSQQ